jgi:3-methyladenine DNA glycosylase AlkD
MKNMVSLSAINKDFAELADPRKAKILSRFFKTGKGEYGEGDVFLGLTVPEQRALSKKYANLPRSDLSKLLNSKIHEKRLTALLIMVAQFENNKKEIFDFYLKNIDRINNWDLVDLSAPNIVGAYLFDKKRNELYNLAKSENLWARRISILSTFYFLREHDYSDTIKISEILLFDKHDLIHKATGWMLREMGKRDQKVLVQFLSKHTSKMPRTMLRYAIEKFSPNVRKKYLNKK